MVEINLELHPSKLAVTATDFPLLTKLELEALIYVLQKLNRAWELKGAGTNER